MRRSSISTVVVVVVVAAAAAAAAINERKIKSINLSIFFLFPCDPKKLTNSQFSLIHSPNKKTTEKLKQNR